MQGDPALVKQVARDRHPDCLRRIFRMAWKLDGSLPYESGPQGLVDSNKSWWVQAEAMLGFYNAYQLSGQRRFEQAAQQSWKLYPGQNGGPDPRGLD